jgi:hypothetical protein
LGGQIPGAEFSSAVNPIADRFIQMTDADPAMLGALQTDVNALFALTDVEIAERIMRGEPASQFGDVFDAVAEVAWEVGATELAAQLEAERADSLSGTFGALVGSEAMLLADMDELVGFGPPPDRTGGRGGDEIRGQAFESVFDVAGAWSYSPSSGVLAVTVGEGALADTIGVEVRAGFDPKTHLDVMAEVVSAQVNGRVVGGELTGGHGTPAVQQIIDKAHEVGSFIDQHPTVKTGIDFLWGALTLQDYDDIQAGEGPLNSATERLKDERGQMTEESVRIASMVPFPEDAMIASIARAFIAEADNLDSKTALDAAAELVEEERDGMLAEFRNLTAEEVLAELEADAEGRSAFGEAVESGLGQTLETFEAWDMFSQTLGVAFIDVWRDIIGAGHDWVGGDWEEGFNRLQKVMEAPGETDVGRDQVLGVNVMTAAEYFGLEGSAADGVNLLVGGLFDPLNFVFPGAKGLRKMATQALLDPAKYGHIYVRMGSYPSVVRTIVGRSNLDDVASEVLEGVGRAVDYSNPEGLRAAASMSGLDDTDMLDLVRLANSPDATRDQVEDVLVRAMHKDYLGEGPMRAQRHSTVEGVGAMFESMAAGRFDDETVAEMMKAGTERTFRLGENQALDSIADLLTQLFPRDTDTFTRLFTQAVERAGGKGDALAAVGANQMTKEAARRSLWEAGGTMSSVRQGDDMAGIRSNLSQIEDALTKIDNLTADDAAKAAARSQLERTHALMSRRFDDAQTKFAPAKARMRDAQDKVKSATYLEADVANSVRNEMAKSIFEVYEEVAKRIEKARPGSLPVTKNVNPLAPDLPVRDWSQVTGKTKELIPGDPDLNLFMGMAVDDPDIARGLDAVGMFNKSQKVLLPASPYEIMLFEKISGNPAMWAKVTNYMRNENVRKYVTGPMKYTFAVNLLVNPITAGKVTFDETPRFLAATGEFGQFVRASFAGMPLGVGRVSENIWSKFSSSAPNSWAAQYRRRVAGGSYDDYANYDWVVRPARRGGPTGYKLADYREQAERWVNGTLIQDKRIREYFRWIDEAQVLEDGTKIAPQGFIDWWEEGVGVGKPGKSEARTSQVYLRGEAVKGTDLTAQQAFGTIDNSLNHWLDLLVDEGQRPAMRQRLQQTATTPGDRFDVVKDARLLNALAQVPGLSGKTGPGTAIFSLFFGAPASRRAGVFFEHYFDEAYEILKTRHGAKLLTADRVAEYGNMSIEEAQHALKQGMDNETVSALVRQQGARTESQLEARAAAYAERRADDLMYRFTAASMAGRGVEAGLTFPFARAQMDFLSWWFDHMTKPMTLRIPMEARARLPQVVNNAINTVERVPINLRAMGKYAHLVAAANNDEDSLLDQALRELTFFPFRFDKEFLIGISPQPGALPSWLFDLNVAAGNLTPEQIDTFETLFPALGYSEIGSGGVMEEMVDRIVPSSRRSLREFAGSTARLAAAMFGKDAHTEPGLGGQLVNMMLDEKRPGATGDFQVAMVADFFAEDLDGEPGIWALVPGSDEFKTRILEIAVDGAVEANRQEWNQDLRDRVNPLTGYDAEFRALRAYEGLFDEEVFTTMSQAGVFQQNDLLDVDGQPRIKALWDSYLEGTATRDDMVFLRDRLTTAYFEAGRREVFPGFSFMDYIHLIHPEVAVNLISKNEDSGIPVRGGEYEVGDQTMSHAEFKASYISGLTGRLQNVPEGTSGSELVADARRLGWLVNRPVEEWAFDAAAAVYKSGARAVHGVWEWVAHKPWSGRISDSLRPKTFVLGVPEAKVLAAAGMDLTAGSEYTYGELFNLVADFDERFKVAQPVLLNTLQNGAVHGQLAKHSDHFGLGLLNDIGEADQYFRDQGIESIEDWPEETLSAVRERFAEAINQGYTTLADYRQEMEPIFGPIDYEPPSPPPVAELESGIRVAGDDLADLAVVDGDTMSVMLEDGPMRVRLIGINAPEVTQSGYAEAREQLARVIAGATEVTFGIYKPELFGMIQQSAPGERRLLAWLYVDGVPLYDASVFTSDNPRGAGSGGKVVNLEAILEGSSTVNTILDKVLP